MSSLTVQVILVLVQSLFACFLFWLVRVFGKFTRELVDATSKNIETQRTSLQMMHTILHALNARNIHPRFDSEN